MKRIVSFIIVLLVISCGKSAEQKPENKTIVTKTPKTVVLHKTKEWYTNSIENYTAHSQKELLVNDRKSGKIDWVLDDTEVNDSANYYIFKIGHTETEDDGSSPRFTASGWIYIDSLTQKIYEYDLPNDQLILWKNN